MRKTTLLAAAAATLSFAAGAASAAPWMPMIERQAVLNDRLDARLSAGDIDPAAAGALRADMHALVALEGQYRYGGLSAREKLELDRRYALLDDEMRLATAAPAPTWISMAERKLDLDTRIQRGIETGQLTAAEAELLHEDFAEIVRAEANFKVDGLSPEEREDLDDRFDELSERVLAARADDDRDYVWSRD